MSNSYYPQYSRDGLGKFNIKNNFISMKAGTDAYFLEDEANEMQWIQNENRAEIVRKQYYSGIFKQYHSYTNSKKDYISSSDYVSGENILNSFFIDKLSVNVNGYLFDIQGNNSYNTDIEIPLNYVRLPEPPTTAEKVYDLVYLEMWFAEVKTGDDIWTYGNYKNFFGLQENNLLDNRIHGETCRRYQLKWQIRTARIPYIDKLFDENIMATYVPAYGNKMSPSTYGFVKDHEDKGLWIAGNEDSDLGTINGYSYAIPLYKVLRRNSLQYANNRLGAKLFKLNKRNISDRPDGKFANIIYEDDIQDVRNFITIDSLVNILHNNFENVLLNKMDSYEPILYSTYFGLDKLYEENRTLQYTDNHTWHYFDCNVPDTNILLGLQFNWGMNYDPDYNLDFYIEISGLQNYLQGSVEYVPGIEQEAIRFINNSYILIEETKNNTCLTTQFVISIPTENNYDIFQVETNKGKLSLVMENNKFVVYNNLVKALEYQPSPDYDIVKYVNDFIHIAFIYGNDSLELYIYGNKVAATNFTLPNRTNRILFGKTDFAYGSTGLCLDEIEINTSYKTHFNQIPEAVTNGFADIALDTQKSRKNYTITEDTGSMTFTIENAQVSTTGQLIFSIKAPNSVTFKDETPEVYFDNESIIASNYTYVLNSNLNEMIISFIGMNPGDTYNLILIANMNYKEGQGLNLLPYKAYTAIVSKSVTGEEKTKIPFFAVLDNKTSEKHILNTIAEDIDFNVNNLLIAYNPKHTDYGFCTTILYYKTLANENTFTINKNLFENIQGVFSVRYKNKSVLSSVLYDTEKLTINLSKPVIGKVEIQLVVPKNVVTYSNNKFGITQLARTESFIQYGNGITKTFTVRSQLANQSPTKVISTQKTEINGVIKSTAYVNGKLTICTYSLRGPFIDITFNTAPINNADIEFTVVSEYNLLRSERMEFTYEILDTNYANILAANEAKIIYSESNIFVSTDGLNANSNISLDVDSCNISALPLIHTEDALLASAELIPDTGVTNRIVPIVYVKPDKLGNQVYTTNKIYTTDAVAVSKGFSNCHIDYKSFFAIFEGGLYQENDIITDKIEHIDIFPVLVNINDEIKLAIFTSKNTERYGIDTTNSAMNIYNLNHNYLIKNI